MTSQWVAKRKMVYGVVSIFAVVLIFGVPLFFFFHKTPTCSDGVKNQNEKGIDCGGVCTLICPADIVNPIVLWQRSFMVTPGVYNAVAYIQNPNVLSKTDKVNYVFRLYDSANVQIGERIGTTFVPANQTFAVFEAGIKTGGRVPVRTSFGFTGNFNWTQNISTYTPPSVLIGNIQLINELSTPRINAIVTNKSLQTIKNLEAVAIIYDEQDNAVAASRTIVQDLASNGVTPVTFTWPAAFGVPTARKDILLRVYPDGVTF